VSGLPGRLARSLSGGRRSVLADAWEKPILRFVDTLTGVAVSIAAARIGLRLLRPRIAAH
jgi:hypothetical protein